MKARMLSAFFLIHKRFYLYFYQHRYLYSINFEADLQRLDTKHSRFHFQTKATTVSPIPTALLTSHWEVRSKLFLLESGWADDYNESDTMCVKTRKLKYGPTLTWLIRTHVLEASGYHFSTLCRGHDAIRPNCQQGGSHRVLKTTWIETCLDHTLSYFSLPLFWLQTPKTSNAWEMESEPPHWPLPRILAHRKQEITLVLLSQEVFYSSLLESNI